MLTPARGLHTNERDRPPSPERKGGAHARSLPANGARPVMSSAPAERKESAGRPRFKSFDGPRIYKHVKRGRPCRVCGKTDWCSYSLNEEVSCCARENKGADYVSRQGWGVYFHNKDPRALRNRRGPPAALKSHPRQPR